MICQTAGGKSNMGIFVEVVGEENVLHRADKGLRQAARAEYGRTWKMEAAGDSWREVGG